jgi:hypothetical protein
VPTSPRIRIEPAGEVTFARGIAGIQRDLRLPLDFPPDVEAVAAHAAAIRLAGADPAHRTIRFEIDTDTGTRA